MRQPLWSAGVGASFLEPVLAAGEAGGRQRPSSSTISPSMFLVSLLVIQAGEYIIVPRFQSASFGVIGATLKDYREGHKWCQLMETSSMHVGTASFLIAWSWFQPCLPLL